MNYRMLPVRRITGVVAVLALALGAARPWSPSATSRDPTRCIRDSEFPDSLMSRKRPLHGEPRQAQSQVKNPLKYAKRLTDPVTQKRFGPTKHSPRTTYMGRAYYCRVGVQLRRVPGDSGQLRDPSGDVEGRDSSSRLHVHPVAPGLVPGNTLSGLAPTSPGTPSPMSARCSRPRSLRIEYRRWRQGPARFRATKPCGVIATVDQAQGAARQEWNQRLARALDPIRGWIPVDSLRTGDWLPDSLSGHDLRVIFGSGKSEFRLNLFLEVGLILVSDTSGMVGGLAVDGGRADTIIALMREALPRSGSSVV